MNSETLSLKTIMNKLDLLKKKVNIQWNVWKKKDLLLLATNLIKRIPDPHIAKEQCQSLKQRETKPIKQSEIITY